MLYQRVPCDISYIYVYIIYEICLLYSHHKVFIYSQAFETIISRAPQRAQWTTLLTFSRIL